MGIIVFKNFKYVFECDQCGWAVVYPTGGRRKRKAVRAVGFKKIKGKRLCERCQNDKGDNISE